MTNVIILDKIATYANRRVGLAIFGTFALLSATGCEFGGRATTPEPVEVTPLSEAAFDEFATAVATQLDALLQQEQYTLPVYVTPPLIIPGPEETREARRFARVLANGLTDRMQGAIRFVTPKREGPRLESKLEFTSPTPNGRRSVTFEVIDSAKHQSLVREEYAYLAPPVRNVAVASNSRPAPNPHPQVTAPPTSTTPEPASGEEAPPPEEPRAAISTKAKRETSDAPAARRDSRTSRREVSDEPPTPNRRAKERVETPPPANIENEIEPAAKPEPIDIDHDTRGFAEHVLRNLPSDSQQVIRGRSGLVIFVDPKTAERFTLRSQRAGRTQDGRLRVELDLRSRNREREAKIRVIFLDENDQQIEVTPTLKLDISARLLEALSISSVDPRAVRYYCLVEED